ncbi:RmlC-like cupin domain-containing protein [Spinellus fusiger]|nr:RmlC-like cupin domain-containing protein [Spinellus fusiger]
MLDEFRVAPPGGFPDHPHRGFETVTYMMEGELIHEDFKGHKGHLKGGDLQWMTAGRGIIHSELLHGTTTARGLQQELESSQVTHVSPEEGIQIKVIAGEIYGARSSVVTRTPTTYIDVKLKKGKKIEHSIPANYTAFIYTLQGTALYGGNQHASEAQHTLVLDNHQGESTVVPVVSTSDDCHFVIIGGLPIGEHRA